MGLGWGFFWCVFFSYYCYYFYFHFRMKSNQFNKICFLMRFSYCNLQITLIVCNNRKAIFTLWTWKYLNITPKSCCTCSIIKFVQANKTCELLYNLKLKISKTFLWVLQKVQIIVFQNELHSRNKYNMNKHKVQQLTHNVF